jgi:hypothetical protein
MSTAPKEMINNFINFANSASAFHKDDVKTNLVYIKESMDKLYGNDSYHTFVFIQTETVKDDYSLWMYGTKVDAELDSINQIYPKWSYYFLLLATEPKPEYTFLANGVVGNGVDAATKAVFEKAVKTYEPDGECTCKQIFDIQTMIDQAGIQLWSILCDSKGVTYGYVRTREGLYGTFRPKSCYYTLYAL